MIENVSMSTNGSSWNMQTIKWFYMNGNALIFVTAAAHFATWIIKDSHLFICKARKNTLLIVQHAQCITVKKKNIVISFLRSLK